MRTLGNTSRRLSVSVVTALLMSGAVSSLRAQTPQSPTPTPTAAQATPADESKTRMEIYGFTMLDAINDFEQNDPDWFDVVRPTKLPAFEDEFGKDQRFYESVRQSRLGFKTYTPT